jgi:glycolate oxidase
VQPGVINSWVTRAVAGDGFYYAPDPSSQVACSIGGNVAENSGGVHCLKYGVTSNHVLAMEVVMPDGSVTTLGGGLPEMGGLDLRGVFIGSEGTLGIATAITLRLLRTPETSFPCRRAARRHGNDGSPLHPCRQRLLRRG